MNLVHVGTCDLLPALLAGEVTCFAASLSSPQVSCSLRLGGLFGHPFGRGGERGTDSVGDLWSVVA